MSPRALAVAASIIAALPINVHADEAALQAEIDALHAEVAELQAQMKQLHAAPGAPASAASTVPVNVAAAAAPAPSPVAASATTLWGCGEMNYNHPTAHAADAQADLRRAVIGFSHAFDETTHVYGELEWEHAVSSAEDAGETEVEQLYIEHALAPQYGVRAGLKLVPLGLLNEHHEPTQ